MSKWSRSQVLLLEGSPLELHPQHGFPGWFYVVHRESPLVALAGPFPLKEAKRSAEHHTKRLAKDTR